MKLLPDDHGDQHIRGDGAPDLRLHRVLDSTQEALDARVLLDPLEEHPRVPAALVERGDRQGWRAGVVGQQHQRLALPELLETQAAPMLRIA